MINPKALETFGKYDKKSLMAGVIIGQGLKGRANNPLTTDGQHSGTPITPPDWTFDKDAFCFGLAVGRSLEGWETERAKIPFIDDDLKIILTWKQNPRDLDSHVEGKRRDGTSFHVYYLSKSAYDNDNRVCWLDVDDTTSYGPETVTIKLLAPTAYYYYIHLYAGSGTIPTSGASVKFYVNGALFREFTPDGLSGSQRYWNVFAIKGTEIIVRNTMSNSPETEYAD